MEFGSFSLKQHPISATVLPGSAKGCISKATSKKSRSERFAAPQGGASKNSLKINMLNQIRAAIQQKYRMPVFSV
jgi:hypothetical protein